MGAKSEGCQGLLGYRFLDGIGWRVMPLTERKLEEDWVEEGKGSQRSVW